MKMGHWWDDVDRGKPKYSEKNRSPASSSNTYFTWTNMTNNERIMPIKLKTDENDLVIIQIYICQLLAIKLKKYMSS